MSRPLIFAVGFAIGAILTLLVRTEIADRRADTWKLQRTALSSEIAASRALERIQDSTITGLFAQVDSLERERTPAPAPRPQLPAPPAEDAGLDAWRSDALAARAEVDTLTTELAEAQLQRARDSASIASYKTITQLQMIMVARLRTERDSAEVLLARAPVERRGCQKLLGLIPMPQVGPSYSAVLAAGQVYHGPGVSVVIPLRC